MKTAFSLSGGGSKGDFEVGALHFLYRNGIQPDIICTTSVGSVNGLKLAEGEVGADRGLMGLTKLWLSLDDYADMFAEAEWLRDPIILLTGLQQFLLDHGSKNPAGYKYAITPLLSRLDELERWAIEERSNTFSEVLKTINLKDAAIPFLIATRSTFGTIFLGVQLKDIADTLVKSGSKVFQASSLFNLNPIKALAENSLDINSITQWAQQGKKLRMATVGLGSGLLRYVTETGDLVERDGQTPVIESVNIIMSPVCVSKAEKVEQLESALADIQDEIQSEGGHGTHTGGGAAIQQLRQKLAQARKELEDCQRSHPPQKQDIKVNVSLIDGMLASATIPVFFPPIRMGLDIYVDGGVREVTPIEVAKKCGAQKVFAIVASKAEIDPWPWRSDGINMGSIALRSLEGIAIHEVAHNDLYPPSGWGNLDVKIIQPREDIHTIFTIYPAFIRNRMAYGYMCAADEIFPHANPQNRERAKKIADDISILRYGVARLECWLNNQPIPPSMVTLPLISSSDAAIVTNSLQSMKVEIRNLVTERKNLGASVPSGSGEWDNPDRWWQEMEVHPWNRKGSAPGGILGDTGAGAIAYTENNQQRIMAFVRGADDHLWVNWWDSSASTWRWQDQGKAGNASNIASGAGVVTYTENNQQRIMAFVRGADDHLWVNWWDSSASTWRWQDQGS